MRGLEGEKASQQVSDFVVPCSLEEEDLGSALNSIRECIIGGSHQVLTVINDVYGLGLRTKGGGRKAIKMGSPGGTVYYECIT